jgi:putative endonuclease
MTNKHKNVLYTGVTNNLARRVNEHASGLNKKSFTSQYNCYYLVYYESFTNILDAIAGEKQIKKYRREKKDALVAAFNPDWYFLNDRIME